MQQKKLELLAPAGDWERLEMALAYGADAVYLAGNTFGMRSFAGNFSPEELRRAAKLCRERGVDLHVTCNTMPRNDEMARLPQWLELLEEARDRDGEGDAGGDVGAESGLPQLLPGHEAL